MLIVSRNHLENRFYLMGGKDEGSASFIQGVTLAGVLLDEVALIPRSFVEQAIARCSVAGSRLWFNCNPEGPQHWFYQEWILMAAERNALYLYFTMEGNPPCRPGSFSATGTTTAAPSISGSFWGVGRCKRSGV